jgi:hypothetical protein
MPCKIAPQNMFTVIWAIRFDLNQCRDAATCSADSKATTFDKSLKFCEIQRRIVVRAKAAVHASLAGAVPLWRT